MGVAVLHAVSRRQFLAGSTAFVGLHAAGLANLARGAPSAPVSVATCATYGPELVPTLDRMLDQLGGLEKLVKGRTVAVKLNLTGPSNLRLGRLPAGMAHWVHPRMIGAVVHLLDRAGARRIRLLESGYCSAIPLDEYMSQAGWDPAEIVRAGQRVELENTNWLGRAKAYRRFEVPRTPLLFPAYLLNPAYHDCDTFVSLAKLKNHVTTGVTLSMKNCFGNIPTTVYGDRVRKDEPDELPHSGRGAVFHRGSRPPASLAPPEIDPGSPRHEGYRLPRVVVDICAARPVDLALIDGVASMSGAEGPWAGGAPCRPGVLVAGTNCVNTDAVATAVMGYDPMAAAGESPFSNCDNFLELAERAGLGTRDLGQIEVAGTPIAEARYAFPPMIRGHRRRAIPDYPARTPGS
jgi:uncharacterized protein (DUF362 family)